MGAQEVGCDLFPPGFKIMKVCFGALLVLSTATNPGPGPNGLARTPPMGWMSWEIFRCQTNCASHPDSCIDHNLYEQMTDRIVEDGYLAAGYNQVSIDDCWENHAGRDSQGHLIPDASRFPVA